MIASRGICYNNKIYFFSSGGYCNILDVDAETTQTNIQTGITEYLPRYIAQMGNKFYYQQIDGDHSNIKSLTADTWEIETVCQIPVTKKMDFGVYDEESETLMLSDDNGSYIFNINDFNVLIASEDTKNLLISPKKYYYDLQINFSSGEVKTYLKGEFELGYEITI